jgi:hypothetical protein
MRRLAEYIRQIRCNHSFRTVQDTVERVEDERALGLVNYSYNREKTECSKCGWVKNSRVAHIPNNL